MPLDSAENVRAYALMRTLVGSCDGLSQILESLVATLDTPCASRHFALKLLDPLYRSCQLVRIAECEMHCRNLSVQSTTTLLVMDLKRAAGSQIPAKKQTTRRMRNILVRCLRRIQSLGEYISGLSPKRNYEQVGMDPGHADPFSLTSQIDYASRVIKAKRRTYRTFSSVFTDLASFYEAGGFHKKAVKNLKRLASSLKRAAENL